MRSLYLFDQETQTFHEGNASRTLLLEKYQKQLSDLQGYDGAAAFKRIPHGNTTHSQYCAMLRENLDRLGVPTACTHAAVKNGTSAGYVGGKMFHNRIEWIRNDDGSTASFDTREDALAAAEAACQLLAAEAPS